MVSKETTKSLILATLVVFINWFAYFTFRLITYGGVTLKESIGFTIYISILDFTLVFLFSYLFFKITKKK